jgi:hypothetical protein
MANIAATSESVCARINPNASKYRCCTVKYERKKSEDFHQVQPEKNDLDRALGCP